MDYREIMDEYKQMLSTYVLAGFVFDVRKYEKSDSLVLPSREVIKDNLCVIAGFFDRDSVVESFVDYGYKEIDQEGVWVIEAILKNHAGDFYERGYTEILLADCQFVETFEERALREKQFTVIEGSKKNKKWCLDDDY